MSKEPNVPLLEPPSHYAREYITIRVVVFFCCLHRPSSCIPIFQIVQQERKPNRFCLLFSFSCFCTIRLPQAMDSYRKSSCNILNNLSTLFLCKLPICPPSQLCKNDPLRSFSLWVSSPLAPFVYSSRPFPSRIFHI